MFTQQFFILHHLSFFILAITIHYFLELMLVAMVTLFAPGFGHRKYTAIYRPINLTTHQMSFVCHSRSPFCVTNSFLGSCRCRQFLLKKLNAV